MKVVINFKDKTITVDGFGCFCEDIKKYNEDWVSLEISEEYGARLYRIGIIDTLEDTSFINPWVDYVLNVKNEFNNLTIKQEEDYNNYLIEVTKAEQAEQERLLSLENNF